MESTKFLNNNRNMKLQKTKEKDSSLISQNTQIDSTTIEDKKDNQSIKNSLSQKCIYYTLLNKTIKINLKRKRKSSAQNKNSNPKLLMFLDNNTRNINNNINKTENNNNINNNISNNILGKLPPKINNYYYYKYDLKLRCINNSIPNVLINHLILKNSAIVDISNKKKYLTISFIKRIKAKKLSVFYYSPLKFG